LAERGLHDLEVTAPSPASLVNAAAFALRRPWLTLRWAAGMVRETWRRPRFLGASVWMAPRALELARQIEANPPDVVHLFWGHYPALVGALLPSIAPRTVRSIFLGAYDLTYGFGPSREVARKADVVVTHARTNLVDLAACGVEASHVVVVHRGVDLSLLTADTMRRRGRIACAGRLCREKRMDDVLRVCAAARVAARHLSVVVMGDGPERRALEQLAHRLGLGDAVEFTGHVSHDRVLEELAGAEAFIHMSTEQTERLTNAVKEAMASGCACIVVDSPGLDELITEGVDGWIVGPRDVETAVVRVSHALTHPADTERMGLRAAARIREGFDAARAMATYRARWDDAMRARRGDAPWTQDATTFSTDIAMSKGGPS